jgi:hypothetical protein
MGQWMRLEGQVHTRILHMIKALFQINGFRDGGLFWFDF